MYLPYVLNVPDPYDFWEKRESINTLGKGVKTCNVEVSGKEIKR